MIDVVSLEVAKKLKEAGYPQLCKHAWFSLEDRIYSRCKDCVEEVEDNNGTSWHYSHRICDAPSVGELLEELPTDILILYGGTSFNCELRIIKYIDEWMCGYYTELDYEPDMCLKDISRECLATACGEMYCWVKEKGLI